MVQIKIKGINEAYHIYAQYDDASAFFQQLKERLKFCQNKNGQYFEAFFHIEGLKPQHLKPLFQLCADCHTPVSYTHLDVYKRQVEDRLNSEFLSLPSCHIPDREPSALGESKKFVIRTQED